MGAGGYLYESNYDITKMAPRVFVSERLAGATAAKSILKTALNDWFSKSKNSEVKNFKSLDELKANRPDLVPSRYILVVEGAVGLAVREYIQSEYYKGEFSNVLFFNTPHEGTGFADQAIFSEFPDVIKKPLNSKSFEALIPLALVAYLVNGTGALQDVVINLAKDAIMGMAYDAGSISEAFKKANYFDGLDASKEALWYLAQDADLGDAAYKKLLDSAKLSAESYVADYIGGTQLLNSFSKKTDFSHPNYNIVYSYGFPTIGNGRRTLEDFMDQPKMHISRKMLTNILVDTLKSAVGEQINLEDVEKIKSLANEIVDGTITDKAKELAGDMIKQYANSVSGINDLLADEKLGEYVNGLSDLRNYRFNKDDIVGSTMKLVSIIEKFIPDEYKSELYSMFMEEFSPAIDAVKSAKNGAESVIATAEAAKKTLREGYSVFSSSLSSYAMNFFDEGIFDVPSYSAMANNVAAFKEAGASRLGVDLDEFVQSSKKKYGDLYNYREKLNDIGSFEENRKIVDSGLKVACGLTVAFGGELAVKACETAEFAANVGMIAEISSKVKKVVEASAALKMTKDVALENSIISTNVAKIVSHSSQSKPDVSYTDLEGMMFGTPQVSLASVRWDSAGTELVVPMAFTGTCSSDDVYDASTARSKCLDTAGKFAYVKSFPLDKFEYADFNSAKAQKNSNIYIKDIAAAGTNYGYYGTFVVTDFLKEIRFYVDDLQPEQMQWIKIDFNTRIQISYERISDTEWEVYFEKNYAAGNPVGTVKNPIKPNGLFVFRPQKVIDMYNAKYPNDKYELAGIQEDGVNIIHVSAMNKVGRTCAAQMPYFFQATKLLLEEGWPRTSDELSDLNYVYSFVNNLNYPYNLTDAGLRISRVDESKYDSAKVSFKLLDEENGKRWVVEADLDTILHNVDVTNGKYILDWEMVMNDTINHTTSSSHLRSIVYVDTVAPDLSLNVLKDNLTGEMTDGRWASIVHNEPAGEWAVRAMRAFVVGANNDTVFVMHKTNTAEYSYALNWKSITKKLPQGTDTLVVQAYDFANPDSLTMSRLEKTYADSGRSSWQYVLNGTGFVSGINGVTLKRAIWIDNTKPEIVDGSFKVNVANANPQETLPDGSTLKKVSGTALNSNDTLKFSLRLKEPLLGRDTTDVKLYVKFKDAVNKKERSYTYLVGFGSSDVVDFDFVEPSANRLPDGTFDVYVEAVDAAGNTLNKKVLGPVVVDRTAPSIYGVGSGNVAVETPAEIINIGASVSQIMDVANNVREVSCYKQLNAAGIVSNWRFVDALNGNKAELTKKYDFTVKDQISTQKNGSWYAYIKCYDALGNSSIGVDFFDFGERTPQIDYPNDSINSMYYGKIVVKGIAPNPVIKNKNDNTAEFKLEWRKIGNTDTAWIADDKIEYLTTNVSSYSKPLAIWDVQKLDGEYELRLSVRGCPDSISCPWVSTEQVVSVYDSRIDSIPDVEPSIVVSPFTITPGVDTVISFHLEHVLDTSTWAVDAKIEAQSPRNEKVMAEALRMPFDPAKVSTFAGGEPGVLKNGLNIWQEDRLWNIVWIGSVQDTNSSPTLRLKYVADNVVFNDSSAAFDRENTLNYVAPLSLQGISVPAYNKVDEWNIDGDTIRLQFYTDSAFIVDLSTVKHADSLIFCGNSGRPVYDVMPETRGIGVVYVHPEYYNMELKWNGLVNGVYPSGDSAVLSIVAYNKNDLSQITTKVIPMKLTFGKTKIELASTQTQIMVVGPSADGDTSSYAREKIGVSFGLKGQSAYVTATILNPKGEVVKTLMDGSEFVLAGTTNDAYSLTWGGIHDDSFASSEVGGYKIHIVAKDADGNGKDSVDYEFEVRNASDMIDVATLGESSMVGEYPPVLEIDEAELDENNELRFVGKLDYLLKMTAKGKMLPEEDRKFHYKWEWDKDVAKPKQAPALWKKNRFSMGIHRHRDFFPVTVVTLLITRGADADAYPIPDGSHTDVFITNEYYVYQINVYKFYMQRGSFVLKPINVNPGKNENLEKHTRRILANIGDTDYPVGFAVKVFPASVYEDIVQDLGKKELVGTVDANVAWNNIWKLGTHVEQSLMWKFLRAFDKPLYWSGQSDDFDVDVSNVISVQSNMLSNGSCVVDTSKDAIDENFVCGPKNAMEEENKDSLLVYNPHMDMLNVSIVPSGEISGLKNSFLGKEVGFCRIYDWNPMDLQLILKLDVNPDYWNPPNWGYNNLANRYVRFDPTNKTLYGGSGYFKTINDDNFFGHDGWTHIYAEDSAYVTAFEVQKFPMVKTGMNPLLFNDEINDTANTQYPSKFDWNFFGASNNVNFVAMSEGTRSDGKPFRSFLNSGSGAPSGAIGNVTINPLDISFSVAPAMPAKDAFVQNTSNYAVDYPYKGEMSDLAMPEFDGSSNYKLYKGLASRVHYGVNDWNDMFWDSVFTSDGFVRNPLTMMSQVNPISWLDAKYDGNDAMDSVYSYALNGREWNYSEGKWVVPEDSLASLVFDELEYANSMSVPNVKPMLVVVDENGKAVANDRWSYDSKVGLVNNGEDGEISHLEYIFSKDSIPTDPNNRLHHVPLYSVTEQNKDASVVKNVDWMQNVSIVVDSLCTRDTLQTKHPYFSATFNDSTAEIDVARSGPAPNERLSEIATIRGRVPGNSTKWNIQYTKNDALYPLDSGTQDTMPFSGPYPVLTYLDMKKLQGNTTFFLSYGGDKGTLFYKKLNLHVGTLVSPESSITVQSMLANVSASFKAGAWGEKSVDVTVRTVSPEEYVFTVFKNLSVAGPVVEILPSHVFPDSVELQPVVTVTLTHEDVTSMGFNVNELKIYKPNFDTQEIESLETFIVGFFDSTYQQMSPEDDWAYVKLKARTKTFSSFLVSDSLSVASLPPLDSASVDTTRFACLDIMPMDTLWAGTVNGWVEYPYPCSGKSNYLLQLRSEGVVAAEHQGVSAHPVEWAARNSDFYIKSSVYESRVNFYGVDGTVEQMRGPAVRVDSVAPVIGDVNVDVIENGDGRELLVDVSASDIGSGIAKTTFEVYFGGSLLTSETQFGDSVHARNYAISKKLLYDCIGCRATVKVVVEDHGHNHVNESILSEELYPYPKSLVLWYPMQEGVGSLAYDLVKTGVNLDLSGLYAPWGREQGVDVYKSATSATGVARLPADSASPFSVEMDLRVRVRDGAILTWDGPNGWTIGTDADGTYFIESGSMHKSFATAKVENAFARLVWVFDGKEVSLYKNGTLAETVTLSKPIVWTGNGTPVLGKFGNRLAANFGMMDLRIYKSALTAEQVESLYNGDLGLDEGQIVVTRATDVDDREGLVIDQSCGVAGRSYVRQKNSGSSGMLNWNVDVNADSYALYLLMRDYASEDSHVEVLVNGVSQGTFKMNSSGYWESQRVGSQSFSLHSGNNVVSVRPMGDVGVAGLALVSAGKAVDASKVDYGEGEWTNPAPRVSVNMYYASTDGKTINPMFKIQNMTSQRLENVRLRYYYSGESESVQAVSYYPYKLMNVLPDAGSTFYAELTLPDAIAAYDKAYYGNGPQLGLNRVPNDQFWNFFDDPSYSAGAEKGYVKATGVALLDEEGEVLNEWACYDADGAADKPKKSVRALVADERFGDATNSTISMVVENTGSVAIDGFESRYYFRDKTGKQKLDVYYNGFADASVVNAGGNLYYVSFMYSNVILNPGEKSDHGSGVKFALYNPFNSGDYDASDDPSYHGISALREYVVADSVVVLDRYGNLLWGEAPRPQFADDYVVGENRKDLIHREGDVIYVTIESDGRYTLETVNAAGMPQSVLFNGTWNEGEHSVALTNYNLNAGSYLVLRRGNTILSWQVLK